MWTDDELERIGDADELRIASRRDDGTLRPFVTIWVIRSGADLFVRSAYGPENGWFRRAVASRSGRVEAGGAARDVTFEPAEPGVHATLDAAYHTKYDRYGPAIVGTVVGEKAAAATLRLIAT